MLNLCYSNLIRRELATFANMKKWLPYIVLLVAFVFLFSGHVDAQCSQCKLLAEQSGYASIDDSILDNTNGNNINSAILYIMTAPYLLLGIFLYRFRKRIKEFIDGFGGHKDEEA